MIPPGPIATTFTGGSTSFLPALNQGVIPANSLDVSDLSDTSTQMIASSSLISALPGSWIQAPDAAQPASAPFSDLLKQAVGQVDDLEQQGRAAVEGLISGRGIDVHQAMIASEKAEMGFELLLSLRNKAVAAYQQVLGMQF